MADKVKMIRQHEPLRVPQGWNGQDRAFVIQLERILTDLYRLTGEIKDTLDNLDVSELTEDVAALQQEVDGLGTASDADVYNDLDKTTEGFVLDARQGKALNDAIKGIGTFTKHSDTSTLKKWTWLLPGGILITLIKKSVTMNVNNSWGSIYYGTVDEESFPVTYAEVPFVYHATYSGNDNAWVWGHNAPTTTATDSLYIARGASTSSKTLWVEWIAVGTKATT